MTKRKALGAGLEALLSDKQAVESKKSVQKTPGKQKQSAEEILKIPIEQISRNPNQPRKNFREEGLISLGNSIKENGLIAPIVVRATDDGYELVAGERRWRAVQYIKKDTIDAIVIDADQKNSALLALVENIQREQLNVIEEAEALQKLQKTFGMSHNEIAQFSGKSRSHIANILRLNMLSEFVKSKLLEGQIEMGHARAVLSLSDKDQEKVIGQAIRNRLSVREVESLFKKFSESKPKTGNSPRDTDTMILERELSDILGADIKVLPSRGGKGKVVVKYNTLDQLQGIINKIKNNK